MNKNKFGAGLHVFGSCADRYCLSGYGGGADSVEGLLDLAAEVEGLEGIELIGNWHINEDNMEQITKAIKDRGLEIPLLSPDIWTQAKWGRGSLTAPDAKTRKAAIAEVKKVMDWAAEVGCNTVGAWPGQDGYDYHFQADYQAAWEWMVEGVRECADYRKDVKLLIEYKPKEPRTHIFVGTVGKVMLLLNEVGRDNVGCMLDLGHASQIYENPAESIALLMRKNQLSYMHFNDNWHYWDDDMIVGSVHTFELLETMYWLKRTGYDGWLTLDIFPYREDGVKAASESIAWIKGMLEIVDKLGMKRIEKVIKSADGTEASRMLREAFLGK